MKNVILSVFAVSFLNTSLLLAEYSEMQKQALEENWANVAVGVTFPEDFAREFGQAVLKDASESYEVDFTFLNSAALGEIKGGDLKRRIKSTKDSKERIRLVASLLLSIAKNNPNATSIESSLDNNYRLSIESDLYRDVIGGEMAQTLFQTRLCDVDLTGFCIAGNKVGLVMIGMRRTGERVDVLQLNFNYPSIGLSSSEFKEISNILLKSVGKKDRLFSQARSASQPFEILVARANEVRRKEIADLEARLNLVEDQKVAADSKVNGFCHFRASLEGEVKRSQALIFAKDKALGKGKFICKMKDGSILQWPVSVSAEAHGLGVGGRFKKTFPFFSRSFKETIDVGAKGLGCTTGPSELVGQYKGVDGTLTGKAKVGGGVQSGLGIYERDSQDGLSRFLLPLAGRLRKTDANVAFELGLLYSEVVITTNPDDFFVDPDEYFSDQFAYQQNPGLFMAAVDTHFDLFEKNPAQFVSIMNRIAKSGADNLFRRDPVIQNVEKIILGF